MVVYLRIIRLHKMFYYMFLNKCPIQISFEYQDSDLKIPCGNKTSIYLGAEDGENKII